MAITRGGKRFKVYLKTGALDLDESDTEPLYHAREQFPRLYQELLGETRARSLRLNPSHLGIALIPTSSGYRISNPMLNLACADNLRPTVEGWFARLRSYEAGRAILAAAAGAPITLQFSSGDFLFSPGASAMLFDPAQVAGGTYHPAR